MVGTTALALALVASPAMAQDGAAVSASVSPAEQGDGEIIVTAQRREQSLQDTPIAITALNPAMLDARGVTDVIKIAASTPGLYLSQGTASPNTLQIGMRGALEQNGGTITSESPVAIYIDDVYQSRLSAANYDMADIERVEVLRGPQGTLYGRNSMTGAIKLITRQPNGDTWLNTDISLARFEEVKAKVSVGTPIGEYLALAASGFYDNRNKGWQYNTTLDRDVSTFKRYGGQLALGVTNVPGFEAVLTGRYVNSKSDGQHFLPINPNPPYEPAAGFYETRTPLPALGNAEQYSVSLKLGYDLTDNLTLRSITAYQHLEDRWALDFGGGVDLGDGVIVPGFYRDSTGTQHQWTQELQLIGKGLDNKLNYILGFFYFDEKAQQGTAGDIFLGTRLQPSDIDTTSKSYAAYSQVDYEFVPSVTASVGLRYTKDKKRFLGHTPDSLGTIYELAYRVKSSVWTPKFNLQWEVTPNAMVYGTISRGYRAAGFNSLNSGDPSGYGVPYKPESAWSYEIGTKLDLFDRKMTFNLAAYHEQLKDLQTLARGDVVGSFLFQNAAKAKVQGIEMETTVRPAQWVNLFGSVTYTYDEYQELDPTSQAALAGANHLPLISRWQYQIGGTVTVPAGEGNVDLSGDWSYRSRYYSLVTLSEASRNPSIGRANASVTYKAPGGQVEVYGQVSNLFGAKDWALSSEFVEGLFGYKVPLEPTIWRVGFRYKM